MGGTGAILRARGNKGEVAVELLTDFPQRLKDLKEVFLGDGASDGERGGEPRRIGVKEFWVDRNHAGQAVYWFEGFASISEAEKFRGLDVLIPFEQRVVLPAGQYFVEDLVGCSVFERSPERRSFPLRLVRCRSSCAYRHRQRCADDWGRSFGYAALGGQYPNGEQLIPLAEDICTRIDLEGRRIDVNLPEGLRDLNG